MDPRRKQNEDTYWKSKFNREKSKNLDNEFKLQLINKTISEIAIEREERDKILRDLSLPPTMTIEKILYNKFKKNTTINEHNIIKSIFLMIIKFPYSMLLCLGLTLIMLCKRIIGK